MILVRAACCSCLFTAATIVAVAANAQPTPESPSLHAGMGVLVGEVTTSSVNVQVRLTATDAPVDRDLAGVAGVIGFRLYREGSDVLVQEQVLKASEHRDYIARATFKSLKAGSAYRCETDLSSGDVRTKGPTATFRTLAGKSGNVPVRFVVVTGMNYAKFHGDDRIDKKQHLEENNTELPKPYDGADKHLGYPALESIVKRKPDFFVGTGDNVYYDTPDNPRAETVPQLRQKWHEQFCQPRYRDLFAVVPTYWMIDDHDYRIDDGDNSGDYEPSPVIGRRMMLEQLPVAAADDATAKTYRTHRLTQDLQVWFVENRMYRSDNADDDGPEKTIWGAEQREWLKSSLVESDATFKLLISPTPMVGPDDKRKTDNHTNIGGFRHERDAFFSWLKSEGLDKKHFYVICGDRHWQYHAIDPSGIEEFSCGALIDANSRLGRKAGDPASTDPDGLIQQPYLQSPRSGGFLEVSTQVATDDGAAKLVFQWRDERGRLLHTHEKTAE